MKCEEDSNRCSTPSFSTQQETINLYSKFTNNSDVRVIYFKSNRETIKRSRCPYPKSMKHRTARNRGLQSMSGVRNLSQTWEHNHRFITPRVPQGYK
jgi:hypothetical protein